MLNFSLRDQFLQKQAANSSAEQLHQHYRYYFSKYSNNHCVHPTEGLGNCLWYIKKLLFKFHPCVSMNRVSKQKQHEQKLQEIETKYIELMHTVVLLELYHEDYQSAAHWAKKTLDLIHFFHPYITTVSKPNFIENNLYYNDCYKVFVEYKNFFDESLHQELEFEWEKEFYEPTYHANQNQKA